MQETITVTFVRRPPLQVGYLGNTQR